MPVSVRGQRPFRGHGLFGVRCIPAVCSLVLTRINYFRSLPTHLALTHTHEAFRLIVDSSLTQHQAVPQRIRGSSILEPVPAYEIRLRGPSVGF